MSSRKQKPEEERKDIIPPHNIDGTGSDTSLSDIFGVPSTTSSPAPVLQSSPTREKQEFDFKQRHKTENVTIDRRLLAAYYQLLRAKGRNKTEAINNIMQQACIQAGIENVPDLSKPFSLDDVQNVTSLSGPAIREHQDVEFKLRYKPENLQVDRRLLPAYYQLLKSVGRNKTEAVNHIILEACKQSGIGVPDLSKPFSFEDVDEQYRPKL